MEFICIVCPNGCHLDVKPSSKGFIVTGNKCPRGAAYAESEAKDPRRTVTCVVRTTAADWPCVPVKTSAAVPKKLIPHLLKRLYSMRVDLPVARGAVLIENFNNTGARVVYTRTVPPVARESGT
jgi:CxxC motif-containing protein